MLCLEVSLGLNFVSCRNLIYLFQMKTKEDKMDHSYSVKHDPDELNKNKWPTRIQIYIKFINTKTITDYITVSVGDQNLDPDP